MSAPGSTPVTLDGRCAYGERLSRLAGAEPEAVALACDTDAGTELVTRAVLESRANRLARALAEFGLGAGDTATLALPNGTDFFIAAFACWKLGAVPNPLSHRLPAAERAAILARAQPRLVIGMDVHASDFLTIALLVLLEGLLSADNALVLAILVLGLPRHQRKQALRYGILGAFAFRIIAIVFAAQMIQLSLVKLIGGLYLLFGS